MSWPMVKLGSLCKIVRGSSPRPKGDPRYYGGTVPRLMVGDVTRDGKIVTPRIDSLTEEGATKSRPMKSGDFIVAVSGQPGQPCILAVDACIHDGFAGLRDLDVSKIDKDYLYQFMLYTKQKLSSSAVGAIFKNLTTDQLRELQIPLPPLDEQKRIAEILDKADAIRQKRKQAIELADEFLRSVFLDMFGDPIINNKEWKQNNIGDFTAIKHGFAFKSQFFVESAEHVLMTPGNFHEKGGFRERGDKQKYYDGPIPEEYVLSKGALLVAMTEQAPGLLGSCLEVREGGRYLHNQRLGLLEFNDSYVNKTFLMCLFNNNSVRAEIQLSSTGTKVKHTSPAKLQNILVGFPPVDLQNRFAAIYDKCQISLNSMAGSEELNSTFFNSLSQKAFSGQL
ncbi:restriction endonuclease subunit S [Vibrio splendidus]